MRDHDNQQSERNQKEKMVLEEEKKLTSYQVEVSFQTIQLTKRRGGANSLSLERLFDPLPS